MIELPFQMTFDLDFSDNLPKEDLLNKLGNLFLNINPTPIINLTFKEIDKKLYDFITKTLKYFNINITAINPIIDNLLFDLIKSQTINIKITNNEYSLSKLNICIYNLILPFRNNLYEYIKSINLNRIDKITILHNKDKVSYLDFKNQLNLIKNNNKINKKCYLLPYLEEYEQEKYYSNETIRPFLTCAALWMNPVINSEGKIYFPCYCSLSSIAESNFFELWDSIDLNNLRNDLVNIKQFDKCRYCEKFYKENFFVVENGILEYKNKKFIFDNILNPVKSAPTIGVVSDNGLYQPIPIYSELEIQEAYNNNNLVLIIK